MKDCATSCQGLNRDTFVGVIRYHTRRSLYFFCLFAGHKNRALAAPIFSRDRVLTVQI